MTGKRCKAGAAMLVWVHVNWGELSRTGVSRANEDSWGKAAKAQEFLAFSRQNRGMPSKSAGFSDGEGAISGNHPKITAQMQVFVAHRNLHYEGIREEIRLKKKDAQ